MSSSLHKTLTNQKFMVGLLWLITQENLSWRKKSNQNSRSQFAVYRKPIIPSLGSVYLLVDPASSGSYSRSLTSASYSFAARSSLQTRSNLAIALLFLITAFHARHTS